MGFGFGAAQFPTWCLGFRVAGFPAWVLAFGRGRGGGGGVGARCWVQDFGLFARSARLSVLGVGGPVLCALPGAADFVSGLGFSYEGLGFSV